MQSEESEIRELLPSRKDVLKAGLILAGIGWIGIILLIFLTVPTLGPRWLLFFLVTLAVAGSCLPGVHYLHRRFPRKPVATMMVLIREAVFVGAYVDLLLWLQFGKVLNFALAVIIGAGLGAIEALLRFRERNQWNPPAVDTED